MCKHEKLAKIDTFWRCRECGEIFDEPPKVIIKDEDEPKKAPVKKVAKKGAK